MPFYHQLCGIIQHLLTTDTVQTHPCHTEDREARWASASVESLPEVSDVSIEAPQTDQQTKIPFKLPSFNLLARFTPNKESKEFRTPYQINPQITHKWEAALAITKTGIPGLNSFFPGKLPKNPNIASPSNHQGTFVQNFNGLYTSPILAESGADLLDSYHNHQLKKHRKYLWKKLIVGPQKALRKIAKFKVDFSGLGSLYGTDDFTGENGNF
ncbi:hypothetical protein DMENIID0001_122970 [Sergentomyia squamirostris]